MIVKQSATDMDVAWEQHPRVALRLMVASVTTHASGGNNLVEACAGDVMVDPARMYHIIAGWRCIQDAGATIATAHTAVAVGTVNLAQWDEVPTADTGLWGAWYNIGSIPAWTSPLPPPPSGSVSTSGAPSPPESCTRPACT